VAAKKHVKEVQLAMGSDKVEVEVSLFPYTPRRETLAALVCPSKPEMYAYFTDEYNITISLLLRTSQYEFKMENIAEVDRGKLQ